MSLSLAEKKAVVAEVSDVAAEAHSLIAAEYRGLSVTQMTDLRSKARTNNVYLRVVKNTLAKRALQGTEFECMSGELVGPLLLAFSREDPGSAARVLKEFAKERANEALVVKSLSIGGQLYPGSELNRLADLPTLEQARAMLLGVMQAPLTQLVRTVAEPGAMLARVLAAHGDNDQQAA